MKTVACLVVTLVLLSPSVSEGNMKTYSKPAKEVIRKKLTPLQFEVTQEDGTERPFQNEYWNNHEDGIYVDIVTGEPLFSSKDKYDSGTGWPSFSKPLVAENIVTKKDRRLFTTRTEVRSKHGDSHLGHVFEDGPAPTGLRYCMNSASLRFVPVAKLKEEGYGEYASLFERTTAAESKERAIFAGGCFWCMEPPFEKLEGVESVTSGYSGGTVKNPTYEQVSAGTTGHREVVEVLFDPKKVSYAKLLDVFWRNVDPTDAQGQFCDKGDQYRAAIYYQGEAQKQAAIESREKIAKLRGPTQVELVAAAPFYAAEEYHQDYYKKNPLKYKFYRGRCGRDARLQEVWGQSR